MLIILHFVILRVISNAILTCILFNICIGVKEICKFLIWFIRLFSLHSTFQSECSLISKSEGTESHAENRVAQKNAFVNHDQIIEPAVSFRLVWVGILFPFRNCMTVMEVLITTCYLVIKSHSVNRIMESNLLNFTI